MFECSLEKGSKKHVCPACSQKTFVCYVFRSSGEYVSFDVGRCDRESNCGYHQTPKQFFTANQENLKKPEKIGHHKNWTKKGLTNYVLPNKNGSQTNYQAETLPKKPDYISFDVLLRTLANYSQNSFVQFLSNLFPEDSNSVWQAVKDYFIGTTKTGDCIFWQIDQSRKVRTGKIIAYDVENGKRRKNVTPNWIHAELKRQGKLKEDFNLKQIFFGEHLLRSDKTRPVAIVEAEKTAVIASICFPEFVWLAVGSKQSLKAERLKRLGPGRKIVLYPDADGFALWQEIAFQACFNGQSVKVSRLVERRGSDAEKSKGFDLADYLINEQTGINQYNSFVDSYNAKLAHVLADENLKREVFSILDEQKSILIIDGKLLETEAENRITNFENFREIVLSV